MLMAYAPWRRSERMPAGSSRPPGRPQAPQRGGGPCVAMLGRRDVAGRQRRWDSRCGDSLCAATKLAAATSAWHSPRPFMRVLITGGAGFVGGALARHFLACTPRADVV